MTADPVSVRDVATVEEAIALLIDRGFSAAPVIDHAGRPVGVLSRADILVHDREKVDYLEPVPEVSDRMEVTLKSGERLRTGWQVHRGGTTLVRDVMTPVVFAVAPESPAERVVNDMVGLKVHRLFVVDRDGILVGVISAMDVLAHLA
jgi:CBS domain-containing protein